jgi:Zn finger protein HypA/HybF involved in hydrogenase expression
MSPSVKTGLLILLAIGGNTPSESYQETQERDMTGKYLLYLCKKATSGRRPKSIVVRYGPFVEEILKRIDREFRELAKDTFLDGVSILYVARRSGSICNTCGSRRNFLHTWESCLNCGSPAIFVNYDPLKQLEVVSVEYKELEH